MLRSAMLVRTRLGQPASCRLIAALIVAVSAGVVAAQSVKYTQISKPNLDATQLADVKTMLSSGNVTNEDLLKNYFLAMIADMTSPAKEKLMHRIREDIKKELQTAGSAPAQATHDTANAILVKGLSNLVVSNKLNLHPAVRLNCALLLADLDSVEAKNARETPVPLPAALDTLISFVNNPKLHDSVRLAALVGVTRHATYNQDQGNRDKIAKAVLAFLDELAKSESGVRKRDVKHWMECRGMQALGATVTPTPEVLAALQARLVDPERPLWVRETAAESLGKLKYEAGAKVDTVALVAGYKSLLDTAVDQEVGRRELRSAIFAIKRGIAGEGDPAPNSLATLFDEAVRKEAAQMGNAMGQMIEICENTRIKGDARVAVEIKVVAEKWRSGQLSDQLDEKARQNLNEEQGSEEEEGEETDAPPAEGVEADDVFGR